MNNITTINMIKQQLRTGSVLEEKILDLYVNIPRHEFVPKAHQDFAYSDMQIPLAHDQVMLTPLEEATILQELNLNGNEVVLEIGTGSGFFTALLSKLAKNVISVDYFEEFTHNAKSKLAQFNCDNVELITADASNGYVEQAPYDVIVYTGAIKSLSDLQKLQLLPGGKLFAIVGEHPVMQCKLYTLDHKENWSEKLLFSTDIPKLIDKLAKESFVF